MQAVFLDRDGVISENRSDHVKSWEEFHFIPGTLSALRLLHEAGFHVFVVTNQAIVNRGIVSASVVEEIHNRMLAYVTYYGGQIDDIRYCPHDNDEKCLCRKPRPGMLTALAAKWDINLSRSYMIGDAWTDIAAGQAVGCCSIMVRTGRGAAQLQLSEAHQYPAHQIAADLWHAVNWITEQEGVNSGNREREGVSARLASVPWPAALSLGG